MSRLIWDNVGERVYETGVDRGVLYLPNGSAVPWNGLTSVTEKFDMESSPVYFDGRKIIDQITLGDFSGSLKAITYPDEFLAVEGHHSFRLGASVTDQYIQTFGLCYRTLISDDMNAQDYKLHILYNLTAIPSDQSFVTLSDTPSFTEFEWNLTAVPEDISGLGYRPSSHLIIDSRIIDPALVLDIEDKLYGTDSVAAIQPTMAELMVFIADWYRIAFIDNGDGTWTATTPSDHVISFSDADPTRFQIDGVDTTYLDSVTYEVSDTPEFTE